MKKSLIICMALMLMSGIYATSKDNDAPYVNASSTITKELTPTYAIISVSIETTGKESQEVSEENAKTSTDVIANIKMLLNDKKGEKIETKNYNLSPQYQYKEGKNNLIGYKAVNTIKIKIRDMQSISAIIEEAIKSGATNVSGLKFGFDEENTICNELYAKATQNAYSQAQSVAKALGSEVTGARNINTSCSIDNPETGYSRYYANGLAKSSASDNAAPKIEAASIKVRATIDGTFNIK